VAISLRFIAFENVVKATPMTASVIIEATMSSTIVKPRSELAPPQHGTCEGELVVRMSASVYANLEM
jgi:hypothetical protein